MGIISRLVHRKVETYSLRPERRKRAVATRRPVEALERRLLLTAVTSGQTVTGDIATAGQIDTYTFSATAGQSFEASLGVPDQTSAFLPYLTLYNPSGQLVNSSLNFYTSTAHSSVQESVSAAIAGNYTITVQSESPTNTGNYALELDAAPATQAIDADGDGGAIVSGQTRTGTINRPGDLDVFTFNATAGQSFETSLGVPDQTSAFLPNLTLYNPSGQLVNPSLNFYTNAAHSSVQESVSAAVAGNYTIIVQSESPTNTGNYALELDAAPATQAIDADGDGGAIISGQTRTGTINRPGDLDVFTFSATAGQSFEASLGVPDQTSAFLPNLTLYNPSGQLVNPSLNFYTNAAHSSVQESVSAAVAGNYTIIVQSESPTNTGNYALELDAAPATQAIDADGDGGAIVSGQTRTGTINRPGDLDVFTFNATAGQSFETSLGVPDQTSAFLPNLTLYNPSGQLVNPSLNFYTNAAHSSVQESVSAAVAGNYTIIVQSESPTNTGNYALELDAAPATQAIDADGDGGAIISGQTRTGTINRPGDLDVFTFSATAGQSFEASLGVPDQTSAFLPNLTLYNPSGQLVNPSLNFYTNAAHSSVQESVSAAVAGNYTIIVQSESPTNTGNYALELDAAPATQAIDADGDGGAIVSGQTRTGTISRPGDLDVFTFSATANDDFTVTLGDDSSSSTFEPNLLVYGPNGSYVGGNDTSQTNTSVTATYKVPSGGTGAYTVVVQGDSATNTGTYNLQLTGATATPTPVVAGLRVGSTQWSSSFPYVNGYAIPTGSSQLTDLPWVNLNQASITFSEAVNVTQASLTVAGVNKASYAISGFSYNPATFTATWTFGAPIGADKLLLDLASTGANAITSAIGGVGLDGTWTNGASTFPSGGNAPGTDFRYDLNMLPGDVAQSGGTVNILDVIKTRNLQLTTPTSGNYSPFYDVDGSGGINILDVIDVRNRQLTGLPAGTP